MPVEGAVCADGSATGIGVNLPARSRRVAVFLMAGGACGDEATCYRDRTATNIEGGYGAARFAGNVGGFAAAVFFDRSDERNAFRDWSFVFVPYCTGDGHVGDDVAPYHWGRVQDAFGPVRVDLIDDSGPPLPPPYAGDQLLRTWFDAWQPAFPPDCPACPRRLPRLHRRRHHRLVLRHPGRRRRARARRPRRRHVRGVVLRDWLAQMEADDPAWASVEP